MDDLSDIRDRQDRFEVRVTDLEATVANQASLRADMDNDLGTISSAVKAHEKSLTALRIVQAEQGETLAEHTKTLADHTSRLTRIETDLVTVKVGVHAILDLLDAHLAKRGLMSRLAGRFTKPRQNANA